ncbi:hypothetical protein [Desulfosarcina sp.]|uniref:hypothetical protein n=1 Tax=Desulfosarcina sp. TaxID=2027861 RepID=UPI0029BD4138|nr:hypothetical protein [Desulfosarcina sp.]MDX2451181.1 hypothetical protein [Desulfosarcina sp.]MDX2489015.1 hypothetical protein [Desulfosarcina sp.]
MIIGTITLIVLLFGGGVGFSLDIFSDAAENVIPDKQIVKQIKDITKSADDEMKAWQKEAGKISQQLAEMNRNYDLSETEMKIALNQADIRREAFQEELIKLRFQAKNLMSWVEWDAMYAKVTTEK